ncbi:MAG: Ig-like domain-containing protein [Acetatifactor sp.]|nr:Ig-like domain-containing protein [Acetatifactor sp.]
MIRRLLAFALAGCMVFESAPMTSYAAEPETHMVAESSEQTDESSEATESTENISDESEDVTGGADSPSEFVDESAPVVTEDKESSDNESSDNESSENEESVLNEEENASTESESGAEGSETEVSIPLTKQEDGSYSFETAKYKLSLKAEEGFRHFRFSSSLEAKGEQTLDGGYVLRIYYKAQDGSVEDTADMNLNSYNQYSYTLVKSVSSDKEYSTYLVLADSFGETLAQTESIVLHTKPQDEDVVIYDTKSTENNITFDVETGSGVSYCYYAPTDGSGDEQRQNVNSSDWEECVFKNLKSDTEYYFQFTDYNGSEVFTTKALTIASTNAAQAVYTVEPGDETTGFGITLKADVTGYSGDSDRAYLYYTYTDALGREQESKSPMPLDYDGDVTVAEDGTKSFSITAFIDGNESALEAATEYGITMWVQFGYLTDSPKTLEETKTVKTPVAVYNAEDVTLTLTLNANSSTKVDYAMTRPENKENGVEKGKAYLYYRQKEDKGDYSKSVMYQASDSGTISNLVSGAEYEFVLFTGGVKIAKTYTCPESLKLSRIGEGEVNAFDIVRTWKVESSDPLTGTYYLRLYCWDGDAYAPLGSNVALSAENEYQTEFKTASVYNLYNHKLVPDTDYELKWTLSSSAYGDPLCTFFESVHTPKADIVIEDEEKACTSQKFKVTLNKSDVANFEDSNFGSLGVFAYIRKAGSNTFRFYDNEYLSNDNDYSTIFIFNGLEPETDYEVSLRSSRTYSISKEYAAVTFKTSVDERMITVTNTSAQLHSARLEYALTGIPATTSYGYVHCYIREKNGEGDWESISYNYFSGTSSHTGSFYISKYNGVELKDSTTYEYLIGFGDYDTRMSKLEKTIKGEFTTAADKRTLSVTGVSAGYTIAKAGVRFGGNDDNIYSYIFLFYRAKGEETWNRYSYESTSDGAYSYNSTIERLKSDTEYEYMFVISDSYGISSPDEVTKDDRKAGGTFKTKESKYTLSFAKDDSKITHNRAVVSVTAEGSAEDDRVYVILTLNDGHSGEVKLKQSTGYKGDVTFTNLLGSTEYTITSAELCVIEEDRKVSIAEIASDYKFTTKEAEAPTAIKLSQDKIGLNAADYLYFEGYGRKTLKATTEPQSAAADFDWVSSDTAVAKVYNGEVHAIGAGTAVITVTSKYNKDVKATCEVIVKDYVVGVKQSDGTVFPFYFDGYGTTYKGAYIEGIGLYEQNADGTLTLLSDFEVTAEKQGIVSWDSEERRLYTLSVGYTRISLERTVAEDVSIAAAFVLEVTAGGKGFGITGFRSSYSSYKAVEGTEANSYTLAYIPGITYEAIGEISPNQYFESSDFTWSISNSSVATVNEDGVVTPLKAGDAVLTVTPKTFRTLANKTYAQDKVEITLHIRELPGQGKESTIYALANTADKIGDVAFPADWGEGWEWKYPDTPLVTNGMNSSSYPFEAVYNGTEKYPCETTLNVYIRKITGAYISDTAGSNAGVLEVSDGTQSADKISLIIAPAMQGTPAVQGNVSTSDYTIEIPEVNGLTIVKNATEGTYDVSAQKAGSYTVNALIKANGADKVFARASYKIKAVEGKQAVSITFRPDEASGVTMDTAGKNIIFNKVEDKKDFNLTATVKDRNGQEIDTVLQWKTSDQSVATAAPVSKQDTHTAKITVKGEGHTVITATAKDARGLSVTLNLEVQNHSPRVDTSKATVNLAYDYGNNYGKAQARGAGLVEIVPVYNESITSVKICDASGNVSTDLSAVSDGGYKYLITPTATAKTGNYACKLVVTTNTNTEYSYDFKVSVVDKAPSLSAKMATAPNMFFKDSAGVINLTTSGDYRVDYVTWEDQSDGVDNGFSMNAGYGWISKSKYGARITVRQQSGIKMTNGKLTDTGVDQGTLTVKLQAYKKVYTFENFKIKYVYKKPKLVTMAASSNVAPSIGQNEGSFRIYDKTNKRDLFYGDVARHNHYYDEYTWDVRESVELLLGNDYYYVDYIYTGKEGTKKVNMTLDSEYWREPLNVVHTIKTIKPIAYLGRNQFTFNAAVESRADTWVGLKNLITTDFADIVVEGANPASKKMLDDDLFMITTSGHQIIVKQNKAKLMGETIPAGTYSYKVTPYYKNRETGASMALNTLTLKVKVVNKPVTAKVSPKGALDLTYGASYSPSDYKNYAVLVDPKFSNTGSDDSVYEYKLIGEYSEYFSLHCGYIRYANKYATHYYITAGDNSKLKAGQAYKLAIEYKVRTGSDEIFTVTSNTFTIKPKQSAPKIKVGNDNQTLYAGNGSMSRSYSLSAPSGYSISSAYGSIDCNKDGKADITVSGSSSLTVHITDKDAVGASASGKSYSIPVTVRLTGRDGISKDVKVIVKVKVKR